MDISVWEYSLEYSCGMSVYFLNTIEATLTHSSRERWDLLDTDDAWVCDDKEIELVIYPVEEDKGEKCYPKDTNQGPIKGIITKKLEDRSLIREKKPAHDKQCEKVEKMIYEDNPVTMERHDYFFVFSQEGDVFFFDHVICGSFR
jgi:hypothetical protein